MRILLSEFENTSVAEAAPPAGLAATMVRRIALEDWGDNWFLLALDTPLPFHGEAYRQVLIRSRWVGKEVSGDKGTSVFVLLPRSPSVLDNEEFVSKDFDHVTWAMAVALPNP